MTTILLLPAKDSYILSPAEAEREGSDGVPLESLISNLAGITDKVRNAARVGRAVWDKGMANGGTAWVEEGLRRHNQDMSLVCAQSPIHGKYAT